MVYFVLLTYQLFEWKIFVDFVKFHEHEHTKFSYFELAITIFTIVLRTN